MDERVEAAVQAALNAGSADGLRVLGYGEISLVIGWPTEQPEVAYKRLPVFTDEAAAFRYRDRFDEYLARLRDRGVETVESAFEMATTPGGVAAYVVQPVLEVTQLGPEVLRRDQPDADHPLVAGVIDAVGRVTDERTGLDAQVSNWALVDGRLRYLDVTTPMCFDAAGRPTLDLAVFLAAYPWILRGGIRRFVAPGVIGAYRDPRNVLVDFAANLLKERLDGWIPAVLDAVNRAVSPTVTEAEVRRYYRSNARLWEAMLRLRRADRWWQRTIRRRPYPFLLPGRIER